MPVQNNFNSMNRGNFADRQINNEPPRGTRLKPLKTQRGSMFKGPANVSVAADLKTGNSEFNCKRVNK